MATPKDINTLVQNARVLIAKAKWTVSFQAKDARTVLVGFRDASNTLAEYVGQARGVLSGFLLNLAVGGISATADAILGPDQQALIATSNDLSDSIGYLSTVSGAVPGSTLQSTMTSHLGVLEVVGAHLAGLYGSSAYQLLASLSALIDAAAALLKRAVDFLNALLKGAGALLDLATFLVPVVIVAGIGLGGYYLYKVGVPAFKRAITKGQERYAT